MGLDDFAYVTVGTGIGVGTIVRGRSIFGMNHTELGHIRVARKPGDKFPGICSVPRRLHRRPGLGPGHRSTRRHAGLATAARSSRLGFRRAWARPAHAHHGADHRAGAHLPRRRRHERAGASVRAHPAGAEAQPQSLRRSAGARTGTRASSSCRRASAPMAGPLGALALAADAENQAPTQQAPVVTAASR